VDHLRQGHLLSAEVGSQDLDAFATTVRDRFGEIYEREPCEVPLEKLLSVEPVALA